MEERKEYKLRDFMEFNPTIKLSKNTMARKVAMDQLIPHCRDIYHWDYEPYTGGAKFKNGDTIMARITPCLENGKHAYVSFLDKDEVAYGSTEYIVIRGRTGISDNRFVYYLSHCPDFKNAAIKSMVGTSGRQRAQVDVLENMIMRLPALKEQRQIADMLSSLDDKVDCNKRINDNLEQQAQALFKSWFVDFEPFKDGEFVDSELGMIPKGWKVVHVEDLSEKMASGGTPPSLNQNYYSGEIKWFSTKELKDCFLFDSEKHISVNAVNNSAAKIFPQDTVLMAIYAAPTVGRLGILSQEGTFNQAAVGIIPKKEIGKEFIYLMLLSERVKLNNLASGAAQQNLNVGIVKQYKVILPEQSVLNKFNMAIKPLFDKNCIVQQESHHLANLRDTLLPCLMSGKLKVCEMNV